MKHFFTKPLLVFLLLLLLSVSCTPVPPQAPVQTINSTQMVGGASFPTPPASILQHSPTIPSALAPVSPTPKPAQPEKRCPLCSEEQNLKTLESLEKINNFPFYVMHFYGDYGFDEHLDHIRTGRAVLSSGVYAEQHTISSDPDFSFNGLNPFACTGFTARTPEGEYLMARNFDWYHHPAMLLFTDSSDGYASASMVDISYLGFPSEVEAYPPARIRGLLNAPYLPFDGMNERGLAVGMMAVDHSEGILDPNNGTLDSLQLIRLLLDYAGTVDEALDLMRLYNVDFGQGPAIHYLIADAKGESVVVEYLDGEMRLTYSRVPWQISTNFLFSETPIERAREVCWRYKTADLALSSTSGVATSQEAMAILERVSQAGTIWSLVYHQTSGQILVAIGRDFQKFYPFQLEK